VGGAAVAAGAACIVVRRTPSAPTPSRPRAQRTHLHVVRGGLRRGRLVQVRALARTLGRPLKRAHLSFRRGRLRRALSVHVRALGRAAAWALKRAHLRVLSGGLRRALSV
jgi:hypothetical protein